jgi:1,2-dihydroxy-3-keto-5-methylthiopentene dioxygenase
MNALTVYHDLHPECPIKMLTHLDDIARTLSEIDVGFEHLDVVPASASAMTEAEIADHYQQEVERLKAERHCPAADVIRLDRQAFDRTAAYPDLRVEHVQNEPELWLVVDGACLLALHASDRVFAIHCKAGNVIAVPASYARWFNFGERPHFAAIRFHAGTNGRFTKVLENGIAERFPGLDA